MYDQLIETFIIVCMTGSFSKAARQLYLSTAAIQKQINQLEKRTGLTLFTRHKNGVVLTSAGNLFYHRAQRKNRGGLEDETIRLRLYPRFDQRTERRPSAACAAGDRHTGKEYFSGPAVRQGFRPAAVSEAAAENEKRRSALYQEHRPSGA